MAVTARELFTTWGFDIDDKPLQQLNKNLNSIKNTLKVVGIAAVASAGALFGIAKSVAIAGDQTAKTADKLGVGIEALQEMRFAADRAGVGIKSFDVGLQRFTRRASEAATGTGVAKDTLIELGVQLKDSQGNLRPIEDLLGDVAEGFKKIPSQSDRVRHAFKLFDTEGVALVNLLQQGKGAMEDYREEARRMGYVISTETARAAEEFQDRWKDVTSVIVGLRNELGSKLIPIFTDLMIRFREFVLQNRELIKTNLNKFIQGLIRVLKILTIIGKGMWTTINRIVSLFGGWEKAIVGLVKIVGVFLALKMTAALGGIVLALGQLAVGFNAVGKAALFAQAKALAIPLLIGAGIIALGLIIEDVIGYFQGKDSITGRLLASFQETFPKLHKFLSDFFGAYIRGAKLLISGFKTVFGWIMAIGKAVGKSINPALGAMGGLFKGGALGGINEMTRGITPATAPISTTNRNVTGNVSIKPKIDISVNGAGNPKEVGLAVATEVKNVFSGIVRETGRDFPQTIEE